MFVNLIPGDLTLPLLSTSHFISIYTCEVINISNVRNCNHLGSWWCHFFFFFTLRPKAGFSITCNWNTINGKYCSSFRNVAYWFEPKIYSINTYIHQGICLLFYEYHVVAFSNHMKLILVFLNYLIPWLFLSEI